MIGDQHDLDLIDEKFLDIEPVYSFGPYPTGKSTKESDIELVLIFKTLDDSSRFDRHLPLMLLAAKIDSGIEPHPISLRDFNSGNPLVAEIKKTGIEVAA